MLKFTIINQIIFDVQGNHVDSKSTVRFAYEMASAINMEMNRLAIVQFEQETIHQVLKEWGMTNYLTLIIGDQSIEDFCLTMCVHLDATTGLIVAAMQQSDRKIVITPLYKNYKNLIKLHPDQIKEIFDYVFDHPECILPEHLPPAG